MAKATTSNTVKGTVKCKRKGIHSKSKSSKIKTSKSYKKRNRGQG